MLLVIKLNFDDFQAYRQEFNKCLKYNCENTHIQEIILLTDLNINDIPKHTKLKHIVKRGISSTEAIDYAKRISKQDKIIFSNSFFIFTHELNRIDWNTIPIQTNNYTIFNRQTNYKMVNMSPQPSRDILKESVDIHQLKEDTIVTEVIRKKGELVKVEPKLNQQQLEKIDVVIVSVNYNDYLLLSLTNNTKLFSNITVVTSSDDLMCQRICEKFGVKCVITDRMYENGATFNKGKAINEGINSIENPGWILLLDADIVVEDKIDLKSLSWDHLYISDRWICTDYQRYKNYKSGEIPLESIGEYEVNKGLGFFQLFNASKERFFPETSEDAAWSDLMFRDKFSKRKDIENKIIHLGHAYKNWDGRVTSRFISDEEFHSLYTRKSTYTICSYYFNFRNDIRQKENFIKFLQQFTGFYDKMIVGLVDYEDGDLDFEIPCEKIVIKGDKENKLWSKEIIINQIIEKVNTDYLIWIDGDLIYEDLSWLNNIDSVVKGNDFIQLFETINYLGENGEILETHKSIMSSGRSDIDNLLGEGYKPGGAWLGRTSILKEKKLFDQMYVGGGDTIFVYGLFGITDGWTLERVKENNSKVSENARLWIQNFHLYKSSLLRLSIKHLFHGYLKHREYNSRYKSLCSSQESIPNSVEVKFLYMIPSYNRFEKLREIIDKISSFKNSLVIVINDGSNDERYRELKNEKKVLYIENEKNYGKVGFWKTIDKLLKESKKIKFEFGILMSDDLKFVDNFEIKISKYKSKKYILSLSRQNDVVTNWGFKNWIDGVFCAPYRFYEDLQFEIHETNIIDEKSSSGVGQQMTKRLNDLGWTVEYYNSLLVHNDEGRSVMHPIHRKNEPLVTKNINDEPVIICGLATTIERKDILIDTINSIINQVDKLIIYQNGYKNEKLESLNEKIDIISSIDTKIDMGDAGKFYSVSKYKNSYYFSIDDDLIYPPDYVERTINRLIELKNQSVVSYHGKNYSKFSKSYYVDLEAKENYRCLDRVDEDKAVEFPGTGVMCFHTDYLKLKFENFEYPNMADVFLGIELKKNNKNCLCLKHDKNWIRQNNIDKKNSLYNLNKSNQKIDEVFNRRSLQKICIVTTMWKRPLLTDFVLEYYKNLQYELRNEINLILISCGSEGEISKRISEKNNFFYIEFENEPLTQKHNKAFEVTKEFDPDSVILVGSDDLISKEVILRAKYLTTDNDLIGFKDFYLLDDEKEIRHWSGYVGTREGESIGGGRTFSKKLLENLDWRPWGEEISNRSLDLIFTKRIKNMQVKIKVVESSTENGLVFTIRTNTNITKMSQLGEIVDGLLIEEKIMPLPKLYNIQKQEIQL